MSKSITKQLKKALYEFNRELLANPRHNDANYMSNLNTMKRKLAKVISIAESEIDLIDDFKESLK